MKVAQYFLTHSVYTGLGILYPGDESNMQVYIRRQTTIASTAVFLKYISRRCIINRKSHSQFTAAQTYSLRVKTGQAIIAVCQCAIEQHYNYNVSKQYSTLARADNGSRGSWVNKCEWVTGQYHKTLDA